MSRLRHRFTILIHPDDILEFLRGTAIGRKKMVWDAMRGLDLREIVGQEEVPRVVGYGIDRETGQFFIELEHPAFDPVCPGRIVESVTVFSDWKEK